MSQHYHGNGRGLGDSLERRRRRSGGGRKGGGPVRHMLEALESRMLLSEVGLTAPTTVVHWWGDYIRSEPGKQEYGNGMFRGDDGRGTRIENIDLDGDGDTTDDEVLHWTFSMADQLNPPGPDSGSANWGYMTDRPSAKFYGGMVVWRANYKPTWTDPTTGRAWRVGADQVTVEGAEGANPHLPPDWLFPHGVVRGQFAYVPDDKYSDIAVFPYDGAGEFQVKPTEGPDDLVAFRAILLWKKEDFLSGGNAASRVVLDGNSLLSVDVTRHWRNLTARWVVQDGDAFYASEAAIDRNGPDGSDLRYGKVNSVVPAQTRWARFDPTAVASPKDFGYLDFDAAAASWEYREFSDVRSVGIHLEQDRFGYYPDGMMFVMDNIQVDASLVPGSPGVIGFDSGKRMIEESIGTMKLAVNRTGGSWGAATVDYTTLGGTATAGSDYSPVSGSLTFTSGQTSGFIEIPIVDDVLLERGETLRATLSNVTGGASLSSVPLTILVIRDSGTGVIAMGSTEGGTVRAFSLGSHAVRFTAQPFGKSYRGGIRVATGDVNGDLVPDVIVAPGAGVAPTVFVYDGLNGGLLCRFNAYDAQFTGGVWVAAGDVNGDGKAEVITGPGAGTLGEVRVFDGRRGRLLKRVSAYGGKFKGGVVVASGDADGDGVVDVITAPVAGVTTVVKMFKGSDLTSIRSLYPYEWYKTYKGGVNLAAGDVDGDGRDELVISPALGGGLTPKVRVFRMSEDKGTTSDPLYAEAYHGGLSIAAADVNGDGKEDILTVPTSAFSTLVRMVDGTTFADRGSFWPFGKRSQGGVYLAASR